MPASPGALGRGLRLAVVLLPSLLAREAGGQARFEVGSATVGEALRALPIADFLLDDRGELRRLVNVYVEGRDVREGVGLATPLTGAETVRIVAAVAGGRAASRAGRRGRPS